MKKVLFYSHQLNLRGTTNAIVDYAEYNQTILGNESTIIFNSGLRDPGKLDILSDQNVINKLSKRFNVIGYDAGPDDNFGPMESIAAQYDLFYFLKAGKKEKPEIKSTKTANHVVFQAYEPHGDVYAYVSEWLSNHCSDGLLQYVPHIVSLPPPNLDVRKKLGIPRTKFVFGRHGGMTTFDLPFVHKTIENIVTTRDDVVFLMVNTKKFLDHPSIIYLPSFFGAQETSNFVNACDAMIHGRSHGESFGLAICDFLYHNKPVLAWEGGIDKNHVTLLGKHGLLYNEQNLYAKMIHVRHILNRTFKQIVEPFSPENVMKKFDEVFIK